MRETDSAERARSWVVDYSAARAKAIEWLGDRYLLAKPVNRSSASNHAKGGQRPAPETLAIRSTSRSCSSDKLWSRS
jgi:hypothetical protein